MVISMRPTLDWTPGIRDSRAAATPASGTALPAADTGSFDEFFRAGDEGRYQGGPADFEPLELELDEPDPVKRVVRTPEQEARRARFIKAVAMLVGCFASITAVALLRSSTATASEPSEQRPAAVAAAPSVVVAAAKPARVEEPKVEPAAPPRAKPAPAEAPSVRSESPAPPVVRARRAAPPPEVAPAPAPEPAPRFIPSGPPPTAAFPVP
jgi:hypothetical protein